MLCMCAHLFVYVCIHVPMHTYTSTYVHTCIHVTYRSLEIVHCYVGNETHENLLHKEIVT